MNYLIGFDEFYTLNKHLHTHEYIFLYIYISILHLAKNLMYNKKEMFCIQKILCGHLTENKIYIFHK